MVTEKQYRSFSYTARGESHKKSDLDCQDASLDNDKDNDGRMSIAVVADGHGSPQYFRSDIGSRKATEVTMKGLKEFIAQNLANPDLFLDGDGQKLLEGLAKNIIATWFGEVEDDARENPFADDKRLELIDERYKRKYLNDPSHQYFYHAYGTTLIAVALTENYWFGLQIGDGKCVALFDDGSWDQPIPWDDRCFLNATTSICDDDAISEFRYWYGPTKKDMRKPLAVFIGSDGVDDTFPLHENEKYLKNLYRSTILSIAKDVFDNAAMQIDALVQKLAEQGSQDDVSIAGIVGALSPELIKYLSLQDETEKANEKAIEERKRAELKKQAQQAAEARAEQQKKQEQKLHEEVQLARQELQQKQLLIEHLEAEHKKQKEALKKAQKEIDATTEELNKTKSELQKAEVESGIQQESRRSAELEWKAADTKAQQMEEFCRSLEAQLRGFKIGNEIVELGSDAAQVIQKSIDITVEVFRKIQEPEESED